MKPKLLIVQLVGFCLSLYLHSSSAITCVESGLGTPTMTKDGCFVCITNKTPSGPSQAIISRVCSTDTGPKSNSCNPLLGCVENCKTDCCNAYDTPCFVDSTTGSATTIGNGNPQPTKQPVDPVVAPDKSGGMKLESGDQSKVALFVGTLFMIFTSCFV